MMQGKYEVGVDHIRSLAITCHALDGQFDKLFNSETICGNSQRITDSYNQLLHTNLLNLAISIRVSLCGEPEYNSKPSAITACGLFEIGAQKKNRNFTIKDVCDKLIHADSIYKPVEAGVQGASCELGGSYKGEPWKFGLGVGIFCEYILKWLENIEGRPLGQR